MFSDFVNQRPDYQESDIEYVFARVDQGESCSIIGMGSGGKSTLLHQMRKEEVQQHHLSDRARTTLMVYLDPHTFNHLEGHAKETYGASWIGWELMLRGLMITLSDRRYEKLGTDEHELVRIEETYTEITNLYNRFVYPETLLHSQRGFRCVEDAVYALLVKNHSNEKYRLVFMFDELEEFFRILPTTFFQALRGLRDQHKGRVIYITTSRAAVKDVISKKIAKGSWQRSEGHVVEGFAELLHNYQRYVSLLDENTYNETWERYCNRDQVRLSVTWKKLLREITAGHVGLMRRAFKSLVEYSQDFPNQPNSKAVVDYMLTQPNVLEECQIIFDSLWEDERTILRQTVLRQHPDDAVIRRVVVRLVHKNIIYSEAENDEFKPIMLLHEFIQKYPDGYSQLPNNSDGNF